MIWTDFMTIWIKIVAVDLAENLSILFLLWYVKNPARTGISKLVLAIFNY